MKHKIPCELIRDLLPTYIDELTSDVTNEWVEEHVTDCADCKMALDVMREPGTQPITDEDKKEIDFLKKTRKRTRRIVVGSIVAAFVVFLALMVANMFVVGDPVRGDSVYCTAQVDGNILTVDATMTDSARVPSKIRFEEEEPGVINVSCTAVLVSPWNNRGVMSSEYISETEIKQVKVDDRIIWAGGEDILAITSAVYKTRHPYVGDMPANALPIAALNMGSYLGGFSNELQTSEEPYGWSFVLADEISAERVALKEHMMKSYAYVLLAVVENLDEVTFEFDVDGAESNLTVTVEDASTFAGHDIKDCYEDIVLLQNLICETGLDAYAFMEAEEIYAAMAISASIEAETQRQEEEKQELQRQEAEKQEAQQQEVLAEQARENSDISQEEFHIRIVNNAEDDVWMMGLSYGLDGEWKGTQSGGYASEYTPIRRGDSITFIFYPQDFGMTDWETDAYAQFQAEITDMEGKVHPLTSVFGAAVQRGAVYTYVLSGNAKEGYVIEQ